jgi:hypothetical protein
VGRWGRLYRFCTAKHGQIRKGIMLMHHIVTIVDATRTARLERWASSQVFVEKTVAENNRINTTKLGQNSPDAKTRKLSGSVSRYFKPPGWRPLLIPKGTDSRRIDGVSTRISPESFSPKNYADPTHIRREFLDQRDGRVFEDTNFGWAKDSKVSKSLLLTVDLWSTFDQ